MFITNTSKADAHKSVFFNSLGQSVIILLYKIAQIKALVWKLWWSPIIEVTLIKK